AAPIDEFVAGRRGEQDVAGGGTFERRPDPRERIRIGGALKAPVLDFRGEGRELPLDAPTLAPQILELAPRGEAELAARGEHARLVILAVHDEVDTRDLCGRLDR